MPDDPALEELFPKLASPYIVPNANDVVAALEKGEFARLAAMAPADEDLRLIAVSPPREWLEESEVS